MRKYVYADEAGCTAFIRNNRASKYFILCSVELGDPNVGNALLELRRDLIWSGAKVGEYFHATEDHPTVRDAVFDVIRQLPIRVGATILEKSKAQPQIRPTVIRFYKYAWYFHLSGVAPKLNEGGTNEVLFTAASLGTRREREAFVSAIADVAQQKMGGCAFKTHFCPAAADPCLQVADYCAWAIQRKWERADANAYDLIAPLIDHEYETWKRGTTHYY